MSTAARERNMFFQVCVRYLYITWGECYCMYGRVQSVCLQEILFATERWVERVQSDALTKEREREKYIWPTELM